MSDLHLGKSQALGVRGIPIPAGDVAEQLSRLSAAIESTRAEHLLILGDLLHAPAGLIPELVDSVAAWRTASPIPITVVPGNHDRNLTTLAEPWRLTISGERHADGPFSFIHDPFHPTPPGGFTWHGHIHPVVRMRYAGDALRLPAFIIGPRRALLPAFSRFTGGAAIDLATDDRAFVVAEDSVIEVPHSRA